MRGRLLLRKLLGGGPLGMGSAERAELLRDERAMADLFGRAPPAACRQAVGTAFGSLLVEKAQVMVRVAEFRMELTAARQLCYLAAAVADEKGWKAARTYVAMIKVRAPRAPRPRLTPTRDKSRATHTRST